MTARFIVAGLEARENKTRRRRPRLQEKRGFVYLAGMKTPRKKARRLALFISLVLSCISPRAQAAQRELHWDALDVEAHLDADGVLDVIERHTMVFTGDWNGGERVF